MVNMLKTIAESIIHLLTLLLQIFVRQLRGDHRNRDRDGSTDLWPAARDDATDHHAKVRPGESARRDSESKACSGIETSQSQTVPKGVQSGSVHGQPDDVDLHAVSVSEPAHRESPVRDLPSSQLGRDRRDRRAPPIEPSHQDAPPALTLPLPGNLTLEEWGTNVIGFGRKQKGKTFETVMRQDPGYFQWSLARYASLMPEQQDFVRFGQLWLAKGNR